MNLAHVVHVHEAHEETFFTLLQDPAHWQFELFLIFLFDVLVGMIAWPLIKRAVRNHDKKHHHDDVVNFGPFDYESQKVLDKPYGVE